MKKPTTRTELRIIDQIRTNGAFEYDFACESSRLTLHIEQSAEAPEAWRIDAKAHAGGGDVPATVTATAPTRVDALRAVAVAWRSDGGGPTLDWEAIESLLQQVRAL